MFSIDRKNRQSGFTLAEALVATAIFAIIFIAALLVYDRSNKVFKSGVEAADMQQNTRVAFDKLVADVRLAGYDFDRDGVPTLAGEAQQPDEQIEYAGSHALTLRANFNYNDAEAGRDAGLEIPNSEFPIVTTSNDEIVTYALVPDTPGATTDTLTFYADVTDGSAPARQAYPGGEAEDTISITGVDLCASGCNQPPYTLYRFTVNDTGSVERTPLASNIRSLTFEYFNDLTGTTPLTITDAGGGKVDPATPASVNHAARVKRAEIKSIRVTLVGLNEADDQAWRQEGETSTAVEKRRQYELSSIVIPRNLGKRGMREQQTSAPNPPVLTSVCFNYCGLVQVTWDPPAQGAGEVETYYVLWDTDIGATDPPDESQPVGLSTTAFIAGLDPNTTYRFGVAATNSFGQSYSTQFVEGKPLNDTTPAAPTLDEVTGDGTVSPLENSIRLQWTLPTTNVAGQANCITPAGASTLQTAVPQPGEMQGIEIWRGTSANFDPTVASPSTVKVATAPASGGGYDDVSAANCIDYYYRIRVVEGCGIDPTKNVGSNFGRSDFFPAIGSPAMKGRAESNVEPSKPGPLVIDATSEACVGSICSVTARWPAVTTNVDGATIAIDQYTVLVHDNVEGTDVEHHVSLAAGTATLTAGVVSTTVGNLANDGRSYDISARAEQCGQYGEYSEPDRWPKCVFANGSALVVTVGGAHGGNGSSVDPYEVIGAEAITFGVASGTLTEVTATVFNADTGVKVSDLGPVTGGTNSLVLPWADAADNTTFRVDYVIKDGSTPPCSRSGSVFIRDTVVTCPFETISSPAVTTAAPSSIEFPLKNLSNFDVTFIRAEITWDEALARTDAKFDDATIKKVELPPVSGSTPVSATLTGTLTGTGTFTAASGSAKKLFANDMTGNYILEVYVEVKGKGNSIVPMKGNPIKKIDIFYKLPGDTAADLARVCTVYTQ